MREASALPSGVGSKQGGLVDAGESLHSGCSRDHAD